MKKFPLICLVAVMFSMVTDVAANWIESKRFGDIAYFLHDSPARVERYDLSSRQWLVPVALTGIPTALHVDATYLYVAYGTTVYRYALDGSAEVHLRNTTSPVHTLSTDGDLLFVFYGTVDIINRETGAVIDSSGSSSLTYLRTGVSHAPSTNRFFGRSTGVSPADIGYLSYDDSGAILAVGDSPHHGAYPSATMTWPWPNGSRVVDNTGNIYNGLTLSYMNSFGGAIDDVAFHGADVPIVLSGNRLTAYSSGILETGYKDLQITPQTIHVQADSVAAFYSDAANGNGMNVEWTGLDELGRTRRGWESTRTNYRSRPTTRLWEVMVSCTFSPRPTPASSVGISQINSGWIPFRFLEGPSTPSIHWRMTLFTPTTAAAMSTFST